MQSVICNLQYAICNMQLANCNMQYAICNMLYVICNMQYVYSHTPASLIAVFRGFFFSLNKCHFKTRKEGAQTGLFQISFFCYSVGICVVLCIVYVLMCPVLLPPVVKRIAVDKFIISHHTMHTVHYC